MVLAALKGEGLKGLLQFLKDFEDIMPEVLLESVWSDVIKELFCEV